jgi:transposase
VSSAYRNLPGRQQLCWAHLYRAIRDLRYNTELPDDQLPYVTAWYEAFADIYEDLRSTLQQPYDRGRRWRQREEFWARMEALASRPAPEAGEPAKLTRLNKQLLQAKGRRLFTCLTHNTPCDNNRAERDLRPLVLKRRRSFGSKTERGAQALSTVLSICTTARNSYPDTYFWQLKALGV